MPQLSDPCCKSELLGGRKYFFEFPLGEALLNLIIICKCIPSPLANLGNCSINLSLIGFIRLWEKFLLLGRFCLQEANGSESVMGVLQLPRVEVIHLTNLHNWVVSSLDRRSRSRSEVIIQLI